MFSALKMHLVLKLGPRTFDDVFCVCAEIFRSLPEARSWCCIYVLAERKLHYYEEDKNPLSLLSVPEVHSAGNVQTRSSSSLLSSSF